MNAIFRFCCRPGEGLSVLNLTACQTGLSLYLLFGNNLLYAPPCVKEKDLSLKGKVLSLVNGISGKASTIRPSAEDRSFQGKIGDAFALGITPGKDT